MLLRPSMRGIKYGAGGAGPAFTLAQLPLGSFLDYDSREQIVMDGSNKVATWKDKTSTRTFTSSLAAEKPTLVADSWSTGVPVLSFNGSDGGNIMRGDEPLIDLYLSFFVARRSAADQNAVATNKPFYRTGRLADALRIMLYMQRTTTDAPQDKIYMLGPGGGSSPSNRDGFGKSVKALIGMRADGAANLVSVNGTVSAAAPTGASTETITYLGGDDSSTSAKAKIDLARYLRVNAALLPGKGEQLANFWLVEGMLAWEYGLESLLRADHPYKTAKPLASDYTGNNRLFIGLGNSLTGGMVPQMSNAAAWNAVARGLTCENQGVSGETADQIYARFAAFSVDKKKKCFYLGDIWKNPGGDADAIYTTIANDVQSAQGFGAGNAHMVLGGDWIGFIPGAGGTTYGESGRAAIDAKNAAIAAAFPNYYFDVFNAMVALGAPTGPYPDAVAFAKGWIPDVLRDGSTLHLSTLGYLEKAKLIWGRFRSKGWDL